MNIRTTRRSKQKQTESTAITDIIPGIFMKIPELFKYFHYLCYRKKHVKSELTGAYLFLASLIDENKSHVLLIHGIIKSDVVNKKHSNNNKNSLELHKIGMYQGNKYF